MAHFSEIETPENYVPGGPGDMVRRTIERGGGTFKVIVDHRGVAVYDMANVDVLPDYHSADLWVVGGLEGSLGEAQLGKEWEAMLDMIQQWYDHRVMTKQEIFVGTWICPETGLMHTDYVDFHMHQEDALEVARVRGELAIYNPVTDETVHLDTAAA